MSRGVVVEITELTRGHVRVKVGVRSAVVSCEMLVPSEGLSDFLVYDDTPRTWEPPHNGEPLDSQARAEILRAVEQQLRQLGRVVEFVR